MTTSATIGAIGKRKPSGAFSRPGRVDVLRGYTLQPAEKALHFAHGLGRIAGQGQAMASGGRRHVGAAVALDDIAAERVVAVYLVDTRSE